MALPARHGGLGTANPCETSPGQFTMSMSISAPLVSLILDQSDIYEPTMKQEQARLRNNAKKFRRQMEARTASELNEELPNNLKKMVEICSEKGTSSWITALPIAEHGFMLHKGAFRDALCLRYGWRPQNLPSHCVCGLTSLHSRACTQLL